MENFNIEKVDKQALIEKAKINALELVEEGRFEDAIDSITVDLKKINNNDKATPLAMIMKANPLITEKEVVEFINGF